MSEEKKLADEEIVKALEKCLSTNGDCTCTNCKFYTGNGYEECIVNVLISTLKLIHRLQSDYSNLKERYVKVLGLNEKVIAEQKAEIERLKINLESEKKCGKIQTKQTEKDTARKILGDIESCINGMLDSERYMTKNEVEYLLEYILNKKYDYGVEVDYEN